MPTLERESMNFKSGGMIGSPSQTGSIMKPSVYLSMAMAI